MHKNNMLPGAFFTLLGLFFLYIIVAVEQMQIVSSGADGIYGAGFFPFICSLLIFVMGIGLTLQGLKQRKGMAFSDGATVQADPEQKRNVRNIWQFLAGFAVMLIAWKLTRQFIVCTFLYAIYINYLFKRPWKFILAFAFIITAFIYLMFVWGFSVQFIA